MDSNTQANVFSTAIELPTSEIDPKLEIHIWGRCSLRRDGKLLHVDRAGHPSVGSFFNTDDTKEEYNASVVNDRKRWLDQFVHLMGHTGNYTREEAIAAIDKERTLPDVLSFDPSKPAEYPNGRVFTDDVIDDRLAFLTKNECPPTGLKPHTDVLREFPYLGTPHSKEAGPNRRQTNFGSQSGHLPDELSRRRSTASNSEGTLDSIAELREPRMVGSHRIARWELIVNPIASLAVLALSEQASARLRPAADAGIPIGPPSPSDPLTTGAASISASSWAERGNPRRTGPTSIRTTARDSVDQPSDWGAAGGLQGGYNWQSGAIILGVEGDISRTSLSQTRTVPQPPVPGASPG